MSSIVSACVVLLLSVLCSGDEDSAAAGEIGQPRPGELHFGFITSFSRSASSYESSQAVPSVDLALEKIAELSVLPDNYTLSYSAIRDSQCDRQTSLRAFLEEFDIFEQWDYDNATSAVCQNGSLDSSSTRKKKKANIALLGCGCPSATEPVAEISHFWNIPQISFSSALSGFPLNQNYKYFQLYPSESKLEGPSILALMEHFQWKRILFITQKEEMFLNILDVVISQSESRNITVGNSEFRTDEDLSKNLFFEEEDYRVLVLNMYSRTAVKVICEAYERNMTYPRYAWLTYGFYPDEWWTYRPPEGLPHESCTSDHLATLLHRKLIIQQVPHATEEQFESPTDTGLSPYQFNAEVNLQSSEYLVIASLAYDAVWTLALALNTTARWVGEGWEPGGCEGERGSLVPLEEFSYDNAKMGCLLRRSLEQTSFTGVTGEVKFDKNGVRIKTTTEIYQYTAGSSDRHLVGEVAMANSKFNYISGQNDSSVYPDGVPPDGTTQMAIWHYPLPLVIVMDILSFAGICFALFCLFINIVFRKRKVISITSPKINYFMIVGVIILYTSVIFRVLPYYNKAFISVRCHLDRWLISVGFSLAYGSVFMKMIRVFLLFRNPTPGMRPMQDWVLIIGVLLITGVGVITMIIGSTVPLFRPVPELIKNRELSQGRDELGVRQDYHFWNCYSPTASNQYPRYFLFVLYAYLTTLQLIGIVLAIKTRKVSVQILNDSKEVTAAVYMTTLILISLAVTSFTLRGYPITFLSILCTSILLGTTFFLVFIFIPKIWSLYRDPHGERIFEKSMACIVADPSASLRSAIASINSPTQSLPSESKRVAILEQRLRDLHSQLNSYKSETMSSTHFDEGMDDKDLEIGNDEKEEK